MVQIYGEVKKFMLFGEDITHAMFRSIRSVPTKVTIDTGVYKIHTKCAFLRCKVPATAGLPRSYETFASYSENSSELFENFREMGDCIPHLLDTLWRCFYQRKTTELEKDFVRDLLECLGEQNAQNMTNEIGFQRHGAPLFVLNRILVNVRGEPFPVTGYPTKEFIWFEMRRIHEWFLVRRGNKHGKDIAQRLARLLDHVLSHFVFCGRILSLLAVSIFSTVLTRQDCFEYSRRNGILPVRAWTRKIRWMTARKMKEKLRWYLCSSIIFS